MDGQQQNLDFSLPGARHAEVVPSFFLFGEPPRATGRRFLHLEALDDRSRPNGWNIRPHAHADLDQIFHISRGSGVMRIEATTARFTAPSLILVPAGVVHGFTYEDETVGAVLTVARSYLADLCMREPTFLDLFRAPCQFGLDAASPIGGALDRLARELGWKAPGHAAAVEAQLLVVCVEALRLLVAASAPVPAVHGAAPALVARFREAIETSYRTPLSIGDHAARLGVTPSRLRTACLRVAATPPAAMIRDRQMLEARRALLYSNMTIAEIAYHLGFDDPAYFSRFFTKAEGCAPRAFRTGHSMTAT